jgi:hypothetical protein
MESRVVDEAPNYLTLPSYGVDFWRMDASSLSTVHASNHVALSLSPAEMSHVVDGRAV